MTDRSDPNERLGEVLRDGDRVGLRYERHLAHPPERVWRAITESAELHHWMPCDIVGERAEGAEITLPFWPEVRAAHPEAVEAEQAGDLRGRITTWDPPRVFAWTWDTDALHFELSPLGSGTRLVFTTWIGETPGLASTAAGYHVCFDQLVGLVDHGRGGTVVDGDPRALEATYEAHLASTPDATAAG